jgi:hypothetical protein
VKVKKRGKKEGRKAKSKERKKLEIERKPPENYTTSDHNISFFFLEPTPR